MFLEWDPGVAAPPARGRVWLEAQRIGASKPPLLLPLPFLCFLTPCWGEGDFSKSFPMGRTQILIARMVRAAPAIPRRAGPEGSGAFHILLSSTLPSTSPGMVLETGVGRGESIGGLPLFLVTDITGYAIMFKIIGA